MSFDKNEPAFPCPEASIERYGHSDGFMGMDIRTTIATKMMQGLISNPGGPVQRNEMNGWAFTNCSHQDVAEFSVALADALIEELNK